jgi:6,7-dimethyl-8-ribityllumazine synthase
MNMIEGNLTAKGMKIGLVVGRFNSFIVERASMMQLLQGHLFSLVLCKKFMPILHPS